MGFDERGWVADIAASTITGMACGLTGAILLPDPPFADLIFAGGVTGLVNGLLQGPLKSWLLRLLGRDERK